MIVLFQYQLIFRIANLLVNRVSSLFLHRILFAILLSLQQIMLTFKRLRLFFNIDNNDVKSFFFIVKLSKNLRINFYLSMKIFIDFICFTSIFLNRFLFFFCLRRLLLINYENLSSLKKLFQQADYDHDF